MVFPGASAPADGAVTPTLLLHPRREQYACRQRTLIAFAQPFQHRHYVVVFSTTGCFTKTASATAFISGTKG
jgi:hypothetical protein